jgi:hypothetical protein
MENQNDTNLTPQLPQSLPAPKRWYQHKSIIAVAILAVITACICWAYFANQPKQNIAPIMVNHKVLPPTTTAQKSTTSSAMTLQQPATSSPINIPSGIFFLRNGDIWSAKTDGSNQSQVTNEAGIGEYVWVPKTSSLVFDRIDEQPDTITVEVKIKNLNSGEKETIYSMKQPAGEQKGVRSHLQLI